jgi:U3 small nucleolar RNA-associated protein 10
LHFDSPVVDESDTALQTITCLTEVIASRTLPGSIDLVRTLLETLGRLCQAHAPARSDYDYVEQLLISALESSVSQIRVIVYLLYSTSMDILLILHIQEPVGAVPLRIDVLVELIRGTCERPLGGIGTSNRTSMITSFRQPSNLPASLIIGR